MEQPQNPVQDPFAIERQRITNEAQEKIGRLTRFNVVFSDAGANNEKDWDHYRDELTPVPPSQDPFGNRRQDDRRQGDRRQNDRRTPTPSWEVEIPEAHFVEVEGPIADDHHEQSHEDPRDDPHFHALNRQTED